MDLSDLPPELLKELRLDAVAGSRKRHIEAEAQMLAIIRDVGGDVGIDTVLIELWRRHSIVKTRVFVRNRLHAMTMEGRILRVPDKKGFYRHA